MNMVRAILEAIAAVFRFLSNRNDPTVVKQRKADAETKDVQSIAGEVARKDVDAINKRIHDLRKAGLAMLLAGALAAGTGCATRIIYVQDGDRAVPMERDGKPGWWVPDAVMTDLLERATENHNANKAKEGVR